jgi:glycosyltransferase involved in cell wall biosynthesis
MDAVSILVENGYMVEIYAKQGGSQTIAENADVEVVENQPAVFDGMAFKIGSWASGRFGRICRTIFSNLALPRFRRFLHQRHYQIPYTCMIGIDMKGLAEARRWGEELGVSFGYWSMEILFSDEATTEQLRRMKEIEKEDSCRAAFVIVQDHWRGIALAKDNGFDQGRLLLVPNAPRGIARRKTGLLLKDNLGIPLKKRVVLYAGAFAQWAMCEEIVESVKTWPDDYILVMHTKQKLSVQDMKSFRSKVNPGKVFISTESVSADRYFDLLDSADVAIAFYRPEMKGLPYHRNVAIMGLSSGKIGDYLRCGLPILVNNLVGPREIVQEYGCGVCVSDPSQTGKALQSIFKRYDTYVANACRCFNERLDLDRNFHGVLNILAKLS